jgi:hypothetical protein
MSYQHQQLPRVAQRQARYRRDGVGAALGRTAPRGERRRATRRLGDGGRERLRLRLRLRRAAFAGGRRDRCHHPRGGLRALLEASFRAALADSFRVPGSVPRNDEDCPAHTAPPALLRPAADDRRLSATMSCGAGAVTLQTTRQHRLAAAHTPMLFRWEPRVHDDAQAELAPPLHCPGHPPDSTTPTSLSSALFCSLPLSRISAATPRAVRASERASEPPSEVTRAPPLLPFAPSLLSLARRNGADGRLKQFQLAHPARGPQQSVSSSCPWRNLADDCCHAYAMQYSGTTTLPCSLHEACVVAPTGCLPFRLSSSCLTTTKLRPATMCPGGRPRQRRGCKASIILCGVVKLCPPRSSRQQPGALFW